jgi:hypothetical protein
MNKILPIGYEVQLIYECDSCGCEHYTTVEESIFPAGIKCYCGKDMRLEPIEKTRLVLSPKNKKVQRNKTQKEKSIPKDNGVFDEIVAVLANLGYKKTEAKKEASAALNIHTSLEECLRHILGK